MGRLCMHLRTNFASGSTLNATPFSASEKKFSAGRGAPKIDVLCQPGLHLFNIHRRRHSANVTPLAEPYGYFSVGGGLRGRLKFARLMGISSSELTKVVAMVRTNWNGLTNVLASSLRGYALVRQKDRKSHRAKAHRPSLPGGAGQFDIPNLIATSRSGGACAYPWRT